MKTELLIKEIKNGLMKLQDVRKDYNSGLIYSSFATLLSGVLVYLIPLPEDVRLFLFQFFLLLSIIGFLGGKMIIAHENNKFKKIENIIQNFEAILIGKQNFEEILSFTQEIYLILRSKELISYYENIQKSRELIQGKEYIQYNFWKSLLELCFILLQDLRSDLNIRLREQQSTLEEAKSKVSAHVHGTNELEQVSEVQRTRLDKQIEQFEELQKVLVKV